MDQEALIERFGDNQYLLIGIEARLKDKNVFNKETFEIINQLTEFLGDHEYVTKIASLTKYQYIHADDDTLNIDNVIPEYLDEFLDSEQERAEIEKIMAGESMVHDLMISNTP